MKGDSGARAWEKRGGNLGGEVGAGSRIPKVLGTKRKRVKFCSLSLYFAMNMRKRGELLWKGVGGGEKGTGVKGMGGGRFRLPCPLLLMLRS